MYFTSFNVTKLGEVEIVGVLLMCSDLTSHITLTFMFQFDLDEMTAILTNLESSFPNNPSVSNLNLVALYISWRAHGDIFVKLNTTRPRLNNMKNARKMQTYSQTSKYWPPSGGGNWPLRLPENSISCGRNLIWGNRHTFFFYMYTHFILLD